MQQPFMAIAHRGASSYAPENTPAAYDLAVEMGATHIELDVHLTADGEVVVIHDDLLDRTTNGHGPVAERTLAELRALDAGAWFAPEFARQRIPTLAEVLAGWGARAHLHIEIKGSTPSLVARTVALVRQHGLAEQVTITSFMREALAETRDLAPDLPTGWLVGEVTDSMVEEALAMGLTQLCPRADYVTPELVERLHGLGLVVRAWGVSDEVLMRRVADAGADGMTVNFPDKLLAYISTHSL